MGLTIVLEDERGTRLGWVDDPTNILYRLLPTAEDPAFRWTTTIDRYGDTVFNSLQVPHFLEEWRRLATKAAGPADVALLQSVERMASRVRHEVHLYLKFYGD